MDDALALSGQPNAPRLDIRVVRNLSDLMKVMSVRTLIFMGDQHCPYKEEFDGNDFTGLHILAQLDGEPIGALRLRFFAGFAKLERVALRKDYRRSEKSGRQSNYAERMVKRAFEICRLKGYRIVMAHMQVRLVRYWKRFGFKEAGRPRFVFSDHEYTEMICELDAHPNALTLQSDPLTMIRPEGNWDMLGVLDRSSTRQATNPDRTAKKGPRNRRKE